MLGNEIKIALRFTVLTMFVLGLAYPLAVTAFAHTFLRGHAEGSLLVAHGEVIGSQLIGQSFTAPSYFHGRPSAAGEGYDATASSGSNLAPSSQALTTRIDATLARDHADNPGVPVPIDLMTASGSGLDPDISPAAAFYQVNRVALARRLPVRVVRALVEQNVRRRQFGLLGEQRVNVLLLNLNLDQIAQAAHEGPSPASR